MLFHHEKNSVYIASLLAKCNIISFRGWSEWNGSFKKGNKPEWDIETSMLEATMQAFIEEVLRWINTATEKNPKLLTL